MERGAGVGAGHGAGAGAYQRHVDAPLADEEWPRLRRQVTRGGPHAAGAGAAGQPEQEERPAVDGGQDGRPVARGGAAVEDVLGEALEGEQPEQLPLEAVVHAALHPQLEHATHPHGGLVAVAGQ